MDSVSELVTKQQQLIFHTNLTLIPIKGETKSDDALFEEAAEHRSTRPKALAV